jgi:hypothetical protein
MEYPAHITFHESTSSIYTHSLSGVGAYYQIS